MSVKMMYTVESGCYSDHEVHAVFDDEETAKVWRDAIAAESNGWNEDARLGTLHFVSKGSKPEPVTIYSQHVELWDDGTVNRGSMHRETRLPITHWQEVPKRPKVRYVRAPVHQNLGGRLEVMGPSEQGVLKVVSERIAQWKAGAWAGPGHQEIKE